MNKSGPAVTELMVAIADYACKHNHHAPCLMEIDDNWTIAAAGKEKYKTGGGELMDVELEPFHFAVWWNGWLAGIGNPYGGEIAAGELANEKTLLAALKGEE